MTLVVIMLLFLTEELEELAAQARLREQFQTTVQDTTFLNNRDPLFWYSCFVRLFPRGDCAEGCAGTSDTLAIVEVGQVSFDARRRRPVENFTTSSYGAIR